MTKKRKRFKKNAIANSDNYRASRKNYREEIKRNHDDNKVYLSKILADVEVRPLTELELFERGVKQKIKEFKSR